MEDFLDEDLGMMQPMIPQQAASEEELLYKELIGFYQSCPNEHGIYRDTSLADSLTRIIDSLTSRGHKQYESFKYSPSRGANNGAPYTDYQTIKMKMLAMIQRMATEFNLGDANFAIYHDTPKSSTNFHNTNNLQNTQTQSQQQHQTLSIEEHIENAVRKIEENYGESQATEARKQLEILKTDKKWETVKGVLMWIANLGKDALIASIPAIMRAVLKNP
jgi:hypothetical protein